MDLLHQWKTLEKCLKEIIGTEGLLVDGYVYI